MAMEPLVRAAADRLIHHGGFLAYVAGHASALDPERRVEATGWTVRETIAHVVQRLQADITALYDIEAGRPVSPPKEPSPAEIEAATGDASLGNLLDGYSQGRDALIARYRSLPAELVNRQAGGGATVGQVLLAWTGHIERHAIDFAEALPEIAFDPLLLDWALHATLPQDERPRQQALRQRAREWYAARQRERETAGDGDGDGDGEEW